MTTGVSVTAHLVGCQGCVVAKKVVHCSVVNVTDRDGFNLVAEERAWDIVGRGPAVIADRVRFVIPGQAPATVVIDPVWVGDDYEVHLEWKNPMIKVGIDW